ncbi:MAG: GNAT family N-acetyltransferase [Bacteroidales bacterium]|jgi:RimJ/RimL family protein N-acetyltransferase|nr:GNAT family N-acetyltransferase [Bacteroidales bacterium]
MNYKLRAWKISDIESVVRHANNYNVAKWLTNQFPYPYDETDAEAFINSVLNDSPQRVFAIEINNEAVGSIGIFPQSDIHEKSAEIGYWLSEKYWGNGIMPKAIEEIVNYGFKTFDIVRIFARPFYTNKGSQRVLEKAGFEQEARLKKALYKNGEFSDELIYVKLKE